MNDQFEIYVALHRDCDPRFCLAKAELVRAARETNTKKRAVRA